MNEMGKRIRVIRQQLGLNQGDFAKKMEISQSMLSGIESGRETITDRNKKLICLEFGINEEWLLTGKGEMIKPTELTHEEKRLLDIFGKLEPEGKKEVQKYADERLALQISKNQQERAFQLGLEGKTVEVIEKEEVG